MHEIVCTKSGKTRVESNTIIILHKLRLSFLCVKKWFEAQISGILPNVFSYISHFVCSYNFNYTGRPLCGPGIIGITGKRCLVTAIATG